MSDTARRSNVKFTRSLFTSSASLVRFPGNFRDGVVLHHIIIEHLCSKLECNAQSLHGGPRHVVIHSTLREPVGRDSYYRVSQNAKVVRQREVDVGPNARHIVQEISGVQAFASMMWTRT